ncbi:hypothetical protein EV126DRAFT_424296 [Verticillium dahliae]|nr:hypothetical protein EV126DRAFT_424296 [Verticillium dahliae]
MDRGVSTPLSSASSVDGATISPSVDRMSYCRVSFVRLTCAAVPQHVLDDRRLRRSVSSPVCPGDAASVYCLRLPQVCRDEEVGSLADRYSEGLACRWTAGATADEPCGREGDGGEEEEGEEEEEERKMGRRGRRSGRGRWAAEDGEEERTAGSKRQ